jgi:hypothetical protein
MAQLVPHGLLAEPVLLQHRHPVATQAGLWEAGDLARQLLGAPPARPSARIAPYRYIVCFVLD